MAQKPAPPSDRTGGKLSRRHQNYWATKILHFSVRSERHVARPTEHHHRQRAELDSEASKQAPTSPDSSEARAAAVGDMAAAVPSRVALSAASRFPNRHAVAGAPSLSLSRYLASVCLFVGCDFGE